MGTVGGSGQAQGLGRAANDKKMIRERVSKKMKVRIFKEAYVDIEDGCLPTEGVSVRLRSAAINHPGGMMRVGAGTATRGTTTRMAGILGSKIATLIPPPPIIPNSNTRPDLSFSAQELSDGARISSIR